MREAQLVYGTVIGDHQLVVVTQNVDIGGPKTAELKHKALLGQTAGLSYRASASITNSIKISSSTVSATSAQSRLFIVSDSILKLRAKAKAGNQGPEAIAAERLLQGGAKPEWRHGGQGPTAARTAYCFER